MMTVRNANDRNTHPHRAAPLFPDVTSYYNTVVFDVRISEAETPTEQYPRAHNMTRGPGEITVSRGALLKASTPLPCL